MTMLHDRGAREGRRLSLEVLEPRWTLSGSGLTAQYFHNIDFTGLAETRIEAVSHFWGLAGPAAGMDPDTFSVRWTGQIEPEFSEAYTFNLIGDEGVRVWLDGQLILDSWDGPTRSLDSSPIALVAGKRYDIRVDYIENTGGARIDLSWSSASQPLELIPAERLYEGPMGILGSYVDSFGTQFSRVDPNIDRIFGSGSPAGGFSADDFGITWTGQLRSDFSEEYTFSTISDERVRLWIGNELVIDNWFDHSTMEDFGTKWLEAGKWYDVRLEYQDVEGHAEIQWRWSSPRQTEGAFEIVPMESLRAAKRSVITFKNPLGGGSSVLGGGGADPFVTRHDGYYYLTMTSGSFVTVHRAESLEDIHPNSPESDSLRVWDPPSGTPYSHHIWAPELFQLNGKWYIYVAATDGPDANHRMHVLERDAADPFGPFTYKAEIEVPTDRWAIDGTVLEWEDKMYFIWSGRPSLTNSSQNLYIAEMANPWTLSTDRFRISTPQYSWEHHGNAINEGPQILIHDGLLHIIYSGSGFWTHEYALGRLTYNGTGSLLDSSSWTKAPQPVFQMTTEVVGTGHASFTLSPGGDQHWIVYHAHGSPTNPARDVRIQPFTFNADGTPNFGSPLPPSHVLPIPSNGPDPQRPALVGDYNADGAVNLIDHGTWSATFGATAFPGSAADGNGDGKMNAADYVIWRKNRSTQVAAALAIADQAAAEAEIIADAAPASELIEVRAVIEPVALGGSPVLAGKRQESGVIDRANMNKSSIGPTESGEPFNRQEFDIGAAWYRAAVSLSPRNQAFPQPPTMVAAAARIPPALVDAVFARSGRAAAISTDNPLIPADENFSPKEPHPVSIFPSIDGKRIHPTMPDAVAKSHVR
jgi:GH43 family beta-xylosidase